MPINIAQSFLAYINSYATVSYPTKSTVGHGASAPVVPASLIHEKTGASVPIAGGMLVDTGAEDTVLSQKYAQMIGLDNIKKGTAYNIGGAGGNVSNIFYMHKVALKIGTLKPVMVNVLFGPTHAGDDVLGRSTLREYIISLTLQQIKVSEYQAATQSAYAHAMHAASLNGIGGNAQAHYRNRI